MAPEIIQINNRDQWLAERTKDVTSTEISALYGLSPYTTEFELFHQKRDRQNVALQPNERMLWGNRLESAIAHGAAADHGWDIEKMDVYMRQSNARIGSSFDFKINSASDGVGILEIKNVDWRQYRNAWLDDGAGNIQAPNHIEMQIQHQMEVADIGWCALVALVGGNEQKVVFRNRDKDIGADIRVKVAAFWARIDSGAAPAPDYIADADYMIKKLHTDAEAGLVVESDTGLDELISQYIYLNAMTKEQGDLRDATKAQILGRIGLASKVTSPLGTIACGLVKDSLGTIITADMVGTYQGARKGYRQFKLSTKKGS